MTPAQYDAIQMILEDGERFKANDLNIRQQTMRAISARAWVCFDARGFASVTDAGMAALDF